MTNPFSKMMKASALNVNPFMACPQCFQQVKVRGIRKHYEAMHPGKDLPKARGKSNVSKTKPVFAKSTKLKKPKKPKKTNAGKILTRATGVQRLNAVKALNNRKGTVSEVAEKLGHGPRKLRRWNKQAESLKRLPIQDLRSKNYFLFAAEDYRKFGYFPKQQEKVLDVYDERRMCGKPVSTVWLRRKMTQFCNEDKPDGYADYRARFGRIFSSRWVNTFMKRHGLSIRKPTNRKKTDVFERMHKIQNYSHYTIYEMGLDPPSDVSDEEDGKANYVFSL